MKQSFVVSGTVIPGSNRGNDLGAKTANLDISLAQNLPRGLFACTVAFGGQKYSGLLYHGYNSILKTDSLEVHLLDFNGDIYGETITVSTTKYLREEKIFQSEKELKNQIARDLKKAKNNPN